MIEENLIINEANKKKALEAEAEEAKMAEAENEAPIVDEAEVPADNETEKEADDSADKATDEGQNKKDTFWKDLVQTIILAVLIFLILNTMTSRVKVFNVSMQPTLKQGYLLVVNKLAYRWGEPKRGDIIVFHHAGIENQDYIKRIIGLPGDTVEVSGGIVTVNGTPLTEPYIKEMPRYTLTEKVPAGKLFVLGDNRNQSDDSHSWGFVDMEWVVGKAFLIYWPLKEFRLLTGPDIIENGAKPGLSHEAQPQSMILPAMGFA